MALTTLEADIHCRTYANIVLEVAASKTSVVQTLARFCSVADQMSRVRAEWAMVECMQGMMAEMGWLMERNCCTLALGVVGLHNYLARELIPVEELAKQVAGGYSSCWPSAAAVAEAPVSEGCLDDRCLFPHSLERGAD